ncbi:hypothetical protein K0U00_17390, partial [Paenibacillus sepulcri]|nr:hypothetical protein [Paenibacillus sepulcri]
MDTNNGIRQRRQERIRRIMKQKQKQEQAVMIPVRSFKDDQPSPVMPLPFEEKNFPLTVQIPEQGLDPEQMWKAQANPWERTGWERTPQKGIRNRPVPDALGGERPPGKPFIVQGLFIQSAIAAALFVIVFAMSHLETPAAKKGQEIVTAALTEQIDFNQAATWYNRMFAGAPSFIPLFNGGDQGESQLAEGEVALPVVAPLPKGVIIRSF